MREMDMLLELTRQVRQGVDLDRAQVEAVAQALASADENPQHKEDFLAALHAKGETVDEITAFAGAFREMALDPGLESWRERGIDIVGTGGSGIGGYNISSVSAIVTAAAGVPVLKHGGRAVTSKSGAADFLTVLGLPVQSDPAKLQASVEQLNFCFFFAPAFHPAFKEIVPVRKALAAKGQRTIFNILGPLINPARPQRQLLGVSRADLIEPLADALTILGLSRGYAVGSRVVDDRIMDEFSTAGDNLVAGIGQLKDQRGTWTPEEQGFDRAPLEDLFGGTAEENLVIFQQILDGKGRAGLVDTICHNAGAALFIAEAVPDLATGYHLARELLLGGKVAAWVAEAQAFYRELV